MSSSARSALSRCSYLPNGRDTLPVYATRMACEVRLRESQALRDAVEVREMAKDRQARAEERRQEEADYYGVSVENLRFVQGSSEYVAPGQRFDYSRDRPDSDQEQ